MALTQVKNRMIDNNGVINVVDYGADPTGTNDSSVAIQAAITAAQSSTNPNLKRVIYCPAGSYRLNTTITFPEEYRLEFKGDGVLRTTLTFYGSGNAIEAVSNTTNRVRIGLKNFYLIKDAANTDATNGIFLKNCQYETTLQEIFVDGFDKTGTQTLETYNYYYSGIVALYAWGMTWSNVEVRRCGNGLSGLQFNSTVTGFNAIVNDRHGIYCVDSGCSFFGGVLQGNHALTNNDSGDISLAGEATFYGATPSLTGVYIEGEGTNPPWSIVVDGFDYSTRCKGAMIQGCQMNRTSNTDHTRGGILVRYAEETVIQGNWINPTYVDTVAAASIPHIYVDNESTNTRIGYNSYQGQHWYTGVTSAEYSPVINSSGLPPVTYSNGSAGGLIVDLKPKVVNFHIPTATVAAPLSETNAKIAGCFSSNFSLNRKHWLTKVIMHCPAGFSAGNATVRVYSRVNYTGSLVLVDTFTQAAASGTTFVLYEDHPYVTALEKGHLVFTVQLDASFAPTASQEVLITAELLENDVHT